MGTLRYQPTAELAISLRDKFNITTLVETGTYQGESTSWAAENFKFVISIDILPEYQDQGKERCKTYTNILFLLGDTRTALPPVVRGLPPGPALFWLDAHNASGLFGRPGDDCPLLEELRAVLRADEGHCILIDDASCFIPPLPHDPSVWPELSAIEELAKKYHYITTVANDVIVLTPPAAAEQVSEYQNYCAGRVNINDPKRRFHLNVMPPTLYARGTAHQGNIPPVAELPEPEPSITEIVKTTYGRMLVPRFDTNQTGALRGGYALDHALFPYFIEVFEQTGPDSVFLDVGANVGTYSFALQSYCAKIHAFEAQRVIYHMLCGSVALNGWMNIYCHNLAISDEIGKIEIPQFDYSKPMSFGSVEFGDVQKEHLHQERGHDPDKVENVQTIPIDFFEFSRVDAIKIDVEGMEFKVLRGAKKTITTHRPVILIEHGKVHAATLRHQLEVDFNYNVKDTGNDYFCTPKKD